MKQIFKPGNKKEFRRVVTSADLAAFHGVPVHAVCSTFSLARDFEWSSRLFVLDMIESTEEGVGTFLSIEHKTPAREGEEIVFTATVVRIQGHELTCSVVATVGERIVAKGSTGQKILKKENLKVIFGNR